MENVKKYNVIFMEVFSVGEEVLNDEFKQGNVENWNSIHQLNLVRLMLCWIRKIF